MRSIRKQWLLVLILIAIISVAVNTLVLTSLTNKYFVDYAAKNYEKHFEQIVAYAKKALAEEDYSGRQLAMELEAHLNDPITGIKLYDEQGQLLIEVNSKLNNEHNNELNNKDDMKGGVMRNKMMNQMMGSPSEEVDHAEIRDVSGHLIGQLVVTRYSSVENSLATRMFYSALISNSFISIGLVLILALMTGLVVSKRLSRELEATAVFAQNMDLGKDVTIEESRIREVRFIQLSLQSLHLKLKLKQKSRKKLLDELVHQVRTPLTILRTHLEGFEDGIIQMTSVETKTCENQIDNITSIIENMSNMIDAETDIDVFRVEEFDFSILIKQILSGLKVQFEQKGIELTLTNSQKVSVKTDKYKLSQSIYNILTNAYKFTQSQGTVLVTYEIHGDNLFILIEDNGIGISEDDQKHVFDAYFSRSWEGQGCSEGIGLYIVQENLKKINGIVTVKSEVGKGTRFTIQIPRAISSF